MGCAGADQIEGQLRKGRKKPVNNKTLMWSEDFRDTELVPDNSEEQEREISAYSDFISQYWEALH